METAGNRCGLSKKVSNWLPAVHTWIGWATATRNSCKQLHSNIFKPFNQKPLLPEMLQSENLQVFPPKKCFFSDFKPSSFNITPNLKSHIESSKQKLNVQLRLPGVSSMLPLTFPTPLECCPRQIRLEESPRLNSADWNTKVWDQLRCAWCRTYTGEHCYRLPFDFKQK